MIDGAMLVGGEARQAAARFQGYDPATGDALTPDFSSAGGEDVAAACALAHDAATAYGTTDPETRATFLEAIASEIEAIGDDLIFRAMRESGLPRPRLEGERGRTTGQLRLFAQLVRQGDWLDA